MAERPDLRTEDAPSFAELVLAPNPGPMTLTGTNTWVLRGSETARVVVVDPGPDDRRHLEAVAARGEVALVLLTHGHRDHAAGMPDFHAITGAPVRAAEAGLCRDADPLLDGESLTVDGLTVAVRLTPGHSADSVTFVASTPGSAAVLTGDTVLGRGSAVVATPDGRLDEYLASLRQLRSLGALTVLPGHGPVRPDVAAAAGEYLRHRAQRLDEVRAALAAGAETTEDVLDVVYAHVEPDLRRAAAMSVQAQLDYLRDHG
jgi:glyoxylase-like metal-dependent hydrolase (beta-lactamase superfamily II)